MNAKATMYTLAACLVVVSATAMAASRSWFEAYTSGARSVALRGSASFGTVGDDGRGAFVVTLGAGSPEGAVLFTRADGRPLTPGSYALDEDPARGVQALVITGPASHPTGAYRARSGALTIAATRGDMLEGHFTIEAEGFAAEAPADEGQPLRVRGAFTATRDR
ncbi:MAG TPA: hypothetical protein VJQ44_04730 [Gemmatimonadales bacterium]|nr:hypothetical protein [Gemmatimonadales bacterium]